jgi:hypothetical protein
MPLFPYTAAGVADFLDDIYSLADPGLALEAASVQSDFAAYVSGHFILDTDQSTYLNAMPSVAKAYLGERCGFCFIHRLPVVLSKPSEPTGNYSKIIETEDKTKTKLTASNTFEVTGSFEIRIVYVPV